MILKHLVRFGILLIPLLNAGCTILIDTSARGAPCGDPAEFEGCYARSPEVVSLDDPEIYLNINQETECRISGSGSYGPFAHFVFSGRTFDDPPRVMLFAIAGYDREAENTNRFEIDIELAGGSGVILRMERVRLGIDEDWTPWGDTGAGPYHLAPVECVEESGE